MQAVYKFGLDITVVIELLHLIEKEITTFYIKKDI